MSRSGHTPEMEMSRTPQTPNSESCDARTHTGTRTHTESGVLLITHIRLIVKLGCSNAAVELAAFVSY